jgi:hypothetical protein
VTTGALLAIFAASVPAHAVEYKQANVASNDSYDASIVDSMLNAWRIQVDQQLAADKRCNQV